MSAYDRANTAAAPIKDSSLPTHDTQRPTSPAVEKPRLELYLFQITDFLNNFQKSTALAKYPAFQKEITAINEVIQAFPLPQKKGFASEITLSIMGVFQKALVKIPNEPAELQKLKKEFVDGIYQLYASTSRHYIPYQDKSETIVKAALQAYEENNPESTHNSSATITHLLASAHSAASAKPEKKPDNIGEQKSLPAHEANTKPLTLIVFDKTPQGSRDRMTAELNMIITVRA